MERWIGGLTCLSDVEVVAVYDSRFTIRESASTDDCIDFKENTTPIDTVHDSRSRLVRPPSNLKPEAFDVAEVPDR